MTVRQTEVERGRGKQSLTLRKIDKESDWPPVCLSLVLLLAPSLSATGRISLLIHSTRLQHLQPSPSSLCLIGPSLMCPVSGNLHRPALCPTWMGAGTLGAPPWSSLNSKGMFGLKEDGWDRKRWLPIPYSKFHRRKCLAVILTQDNQSASAKQKCGFLMLVFNIELNIGEKSPLPSCSKQISPLSRLQLVINKAEHESAMPIERGRKDETLYFIYFVQSLT